MIKTEKNLGLMMGLIGCLLWATAAPIVKFGYEYIENPFLFAGLRFTLAGLILIPFTWRRNFFTLMRENSEIILYNIIFNMAIGYALFYTGIKMVDGAIASIILGMNPLITSFLGHYLLIDDRLNKSKLINLGIGIFGLIIFVTGSSGGEKLDKFAYVGMLFLFIRTALSSYLNIKIAKMKTKVSGAFLTSNQMFFGGLILLGAGLLSGDIREVSYTIEFGLIILWLALVSAIAFTLWFIALQFKSVKPSELTVLRLAIPVVGTILSWILLEGESANIQVIIGMLIVVASLILNIKTNRR